MSIDEFYNNLKGLFAEFVGLTGEGKFIPEKVEEAIAMIAVFQHGVISTRFKEMEGVK